MKDQLSIRIKLGDEQAFELLFRKYYSILCSYANKFLNNPEEAQEAVQELFVRLWEGKENIDPDESLIGYLFKVTQNLCLNRLRRKKIEMKYIEIYKVVYIDYEKISPIESLLAKELDNKITIAYNNMPPRCREIFELSRFKGLKYEEIAKTLKISIKTVEAHMSKALRILRLGLKNY